MTPANKNPFPQKTNVTRRTLLLAGAAAPALAATGAQATPTVDAPADHRSVVLQDTPHTRAYYARAKG